MAQDELVGNMNMEKIIAFMEERKLVTGLDKEALSKALELTTSVFV
jgi:hypothetical protein